MSHRQVQIGDDTIAVQISEGGGPGALLIHGNSCSARSFEEQLDGPLGKKRRLVAIDLPGHGFSDNASDPDSVYTLPGFARVVTEVARAVEMDDTVLVGWSLGGHIALEASAGLPDLKGMMIFGTPPLAFPPDMEAAFLPDPAMAILFQEHYNEDEVAARVAGLSAPGYDLPRFFHDDVARSDGQWRATFAASLGTVGFADEVEIVKNLDIPLAVLQGSEERVINGDYIEGLDMPTLWKGEVQYIDGAGHAPFWEAPDRFDELLDSFLDEVA